MEAGLDSLGVSEVQRAMSEEFSTEVPATLLFDYPSIAGITSVIALEQQDTTHQEASRPLCDMAACAVDQTKLLSLIAAGVCEIIGTLIPNDMPLMEAGLDSLSASEL